MADPHTPPELGDDAEALIISKTEHGFRVYSPTGRTRPATVTGSPDAPACTCPDFRVNADDPGYRCAHIDAVIARYTPPNPDSEADAAYEREEREAMRQEGPATPRGTGHAAQMLLKRSVSPDGRIDSLSIEFTCPLNGEAVMAIAGRADEILALQDRIARGFLARGRRPPLPTPSRIAAAPQRSVPATILGVGGTDGRFGRRLFLRLQVGDRVLRFYGGKRALGAALTAAGYPDVAGSVVEGLRLDLPCRVVTAPSADGRFLNVERVLPSLGHAA